LLPACTRATLGQAPSAAARAGSRQQFPNFAGNAFDPVAIEIVRD
jgi:hypothetical protein